jgi:hypothetical protein
MRVVPQAVYSCHSHQFAALNKDWLEVAPRSHGHARRANTRRLARSKNPHRYAETRMNRPPPHVHGKEGVDGSSPSEGSEKFLQIRAFCRSIVAAEGDEGRTCPRFSENSRSAASEKPCRCGSCTRLSDPAPLRGKEGVAGRRDSDTSQHVHSQGH